LGASGGKCFSGVFDGDGFTMTEVHRFAHEGVPFYAADRSGQMSERMYWDDVLLFSNIVAGLQKYRREVAETLDAIGIDTWGADGQFVTVDGDVLGKIYCYRDHRLDNMIAETKARVDARRVYEITGIHFQPFNLSNQLLWFITRRREMLLPGVVYLPISSVFYYYLGGVRQVDSSWASVTQLMDAKTKRWSKEILDKLGIPLAVMPEIVEPGTDIGALLAPLAARLGLNQARLIAVGSHDTASAFAAAPIENPDDALIISSGTWSLVGKLVPQPITTPAAQAANMSNEGGIGNIRFLKNCMGTWLVQELRRVWRVADGREMDWPELNRLTAAAPAFAACIDPDDAGFYNPANMEKAIVEYCRRKGQKAPADRGAFLRTVYESLAFKYRYVNEQIGAICGSRAKTVNIVGGGSKNEMLNQFTADALGLPVLAGPEEATAVGNFMVQAKGLGLIQSMPEAQPYIRRAFPIRTYKPQDTATWNQAYARFKSVIG
jgi:sugar (pentulose or hexulose) kinase